MEMPIAILPDADRGMPRWGVAPSHVQGARIGIGAPLAVAQPQARQRHAESAACPSHARFRVRPPPKCHGHSWIGTGTRFRRSKQTPRKPGGTPYREAVDHRFRGRGRERGPEFDDPRQAALEAAVRLDHALVHAADGLFDPVDLAGGSGGRSRMPSSGRGNGPGRSSCRGPSLPARTPRRSGRPRRPRPAGPAPGARPRVPGAHGPRNGAPSPCRGPDRRRRTSRPRRPARRAA